MNKVYVIIGAVSGIVTSFFLYFYLSHELYTTREHNLLFRLSTVSILLVSVLFALIAVKKLNGNRISFMRCIFTGFVVSIVSGLVNFTFYTTFYFAKPEVISKAERYSKEKFISSEEAIKKTPAEKEETIQTIHSQFTPGGSLLPTIFSSFITCMIATIFIGAFIYTRSEESL